jgi:predicted RNase H-like HicB family nuclease
MREMSYTYIECGQGGYIGYLDEYPQYKTEGETIEELEEMLTSLYDDICDMNIEKHKGKILINR